MVLLVQVIVRKKRLLLAVTLAIVWVVLFVLGNTDDNAQQQDGCYGEKTLLDKLSKEQLRNIYVIDKYKALYCKVPKVGCTTWKRIMLVMAGVANDTSVNARQVHMELAPKHLKTLDQFSPKERERLVNSYFKFMFVRHPLDRIDSAHRNKFVNKYMYSDTFFTQTFGRPIIKKYRKNPSNESLQNGQDVTLTEFARHVIDTPDKENNEHWQSQTLLCAPCAIKYDFIGRFENFEDDATKVFERIGSPYIKLPSKGPKHLLWNDSFQDVPKEIVATLSRKFLADYQIFGYDYKSDIATIGAQQY